MQFTSIEEIFQSLKRSYLIVCNSPDLSSQFTEIWQKNDDFITLDACWIIPHASAKFKDESFESEIKIYS